ncbi:MAG: phosphotransferase [Candidatus Hodarchaeales archaeon]|jgi:thiamine kinase-like enzyme
MVLDLTLIKGIPSHLLPKKIDTIQILEGGLNNRNILVNQSYLLKEYIQRDEKNDPVSLRYEREKTAFSELINFNFIPKFINSYEKQGVYFIVRSWVEGEIYCLRDMEHNLDNLVTALSSLHNKQYTCEADYNYFDVIDRYLREYTLLSKELKWDLPDAIPIRTFYDRKKKDLVISDNSAPLTRIHGDLVFSNIISFQQNCTLIDWEYSTYGDSLIDIAYLITQNSIPQTLENNLVHFYEQHNSVVIDLARLSIYKDLMNLMSALWYALQVIRFRSNTLNHTGTDISIGKFEELARQAFVKLDIL